MSDVKGATIQELVDDVTLDSIDFIQLSVRKKDGEPLAESEPQWAVGIDNRADNLGFRIRVAVALGFGNGEVSAEAAAAYSTTEVASTQISREAMEQFVNDVSCMQLMPYLRQAIADLTNRAFDSAITLPMLKRGQLTFEISGNSGDEEPLAE